MGGVEPVAAHAGRVVIRLTMSWTGARGLIMERANNARYTES